MRKRPELKAEDVTREFFAAYESVPEELYQDFLDECSDATLVKVDTSLSVTANKFAYRTDFYDRLNARLKSLLLVGADIARVTYDHVNAHLEIRYPVKEMSSDLEVIDTRLYEVEAAHMSRYTEFRLAEFGREGMHSQLIGHKIQTSQPILEIKKAITDCATEIALERMKGKIAEYKDEKTKSRLLKTIAVGDRVRVKCEGKSGVVRAIDPKLGQATLRVDGGKSLTYHLVDLLKDEGNDKTAEVGK